MPRKGVGAHWEETTQHHLVFLSGIWEDSQSISTVKPGASFGLVTVEEPRQAACRSCVHLRDRCVPNGPSLPSASSGGNQAPSCTAPTLGSCGCDVQILTVPGPVGLSA